MTKAKSEGGIAASPVRPQVLEGDAVNLAENPHVTRSNEFMAFLGQKKVEAERRKADLATELDRLQAEISSRLLLMADEEDIIARALAGMTIDVKANRPAPALSNILNNGSQAALDTDVRNSANAGSEE